MVRCRTEESSVSGLSGGCVMTGVVQAEAATTPPATYTWLTSAFFLSSSFFTAFS